MTSSEIYTSIVCVVIGIVIIFGHSMLVDPTDQDLYISNNLFIRIVILMGLSTYITMLFFSKTKSGFTEKPLDKHW